MDVMNIQGYEWRLTIHNFDGQAFWNTLQLLTWYDYLAYICFALAWFFWIFKTRKTSEVGGVSGRFLILTFLGACFGIAYKLFVELDVRVFAYIFLACAAAIELTVCEKARKKNYNDSRRRDLLSRSNDSFSESRSRHGSHHSHRHSGSSSGGNRRRRSGRSAEGGVHKSEAESATEAPEPKTPKFADDVKLDQNEL